MRDGHKKCATIQKVRASVCVCVCVCVTVGVCVCVCDCIACTCMSCSGWVFLVAGPAFAVYLLSKRTASTHVALTNGADGATLLARVAVTHIASDGVLSTHLVAWIIGVTLVVAHTTRLGCAVRAIDETLHVRDVAVVAALTAIVTQESLTRLTQVGTTSTQHREAL
jgi:hypothetical protein